MILGSVTALSGTANDALVSLLSTGMVLNQSTSGYAYEQLNFVIDFSVSNVVNSAGTIGTLPGLVSHSYGVSGSVSSNPGSFVAFGGQMNFWDATTNTSLGSPLLFNYFNGTGGPFSSTVSASSFIGAVNSPDVLRITGDFFLIGDPSSISVHSVVVPEQSTFMLSAIAGICLLGFAWRRRITCMRFRASMIEYSDALLSHHI